MFCRRRDWCCPLKRQKQQVDGVPSRPLKAGCSREIAAIVSAAIEGYCFSYAVYVGTAVIELLGNIDATKWWQSLPPHEKLVFLPVVFFYVLTVVLPLMTWRRSVSSLATILYPRCLYLKPDRLIQCRGKKRYEIKLDRIEKVIKTSSSFVVLGEGQSIVVPNGVELAEAIALLKGSSSTREEASNEQHQEIQRLGQIDRQFDKLVHLNRAGCIGMTAWFGGMSLIAAHLLLNSWPTLLWRSLLVNTAGLFVSLFLLGSLEATFEEIRLDFLCQLMSLAADRPQECTKYIHFLLRTIRAKIANDFGSDGRNMPTLESYFSMERHPQYELACEVLSVVLTRLSQEEEIEFLRRNRSFCHTILLRSGQDKCARGLRRILLVILLRHYKDASLIQDFLSSVRRVSREKDSAACALAQQILERVKEAESSQKILLRSSGALEQDENTLVRPATASEEEDRGSLLRAIEGAGDEDEIEM
jgi:hypothetical protein